MSLRTVRAYATLPSLPTRGPMPPIVGVIIPLARTNLITNPSIETNTTGYTAVGGSIAQSSAFQYHGTYSLAITPSAGTNSDGAFYGTVSLTAGVPYGYSLKFKGQGTSIGKTYALSVATTGGVDLHVTQFTVSGRWQWIRGVYGETSTTTRRIYIRKVNHAATDTFYTDGWQVESCADGILDATTYIDGDQLGLLVGQQPPAYLWNGTPHAATSSRSALTRAGGYLVNLSFYNFLLVGLTGLGLAAPNNISVPYTVLDGARYQRTQKPPRTIVLPGRVQADDYVTYQQSISDLRQVFDRDLVPIQQPLVLVVEPQDECGTVIGDFAQIPCIYAGGLEGNDGNLPVEDVAPAFTMYVPFLLGGDMGASLTVQTSVANTRGIIKRNTDGTWAAVGAGVNTGNPVYSILVARDGKIYAGGGFTSMAGVANTNRIAYFDPTDNTWHAMGTGGSGVGDVWTLTEGPDGSIYAGGDFTAMGGVANTKCVARWDGAAWNAMGTGGVAVTTQVRALQWNGASTLLYVGGNFTDIGGSGADFLATWNGAAWAVVGAAANLNGNVYALARSGALGMYVGGAFTNAAAIANADYVALWSGSAYSALSTGMNSDVNRLLVQPSGALLATGAFTTAGGITANYNALWNGTGWFAFGPGLNALTYALGRGFGSTLYYGGAFSTAGSPALTLNDGLATWLGNAFAFPDVDLGGAATVYSITQAPDGTLYLGSDGTSPAIAAGITSVTNDTPGIAYPKLTIKGPSSGTSRIYQMVNYTTGFGIWLNLTIAAGETVTFIGDPQNPSFTSNVQGDLTSTLIPGSQPSLMYLAPGANSISFFAANSTVTATLSGQKHYNGAADLVN